MLYIWEAGQGVNLEAKCIKLVIWLELLEWFPDDVSRRKLELSGSIAAVWIWREKIKNRGKKWDHLTRKPVSIFRPLVMKFSSWNISFLSYVLNLDQLTRKVCPCSLGVPGSEFDVSILEMSSLVKLRLLWLSFFGFHMSCKERPPCSESLW